MRDIPRLYATGVTDGKIHPHCFFNTCAHVSLLTSGWHASFACRCQPR
jgi:hypothetical protein